MIGSTLTMADDDTFEHLFRTWESSGYDTTEMRATHADIAAMPVGDPTPPPGTLLVEPTLVLPPPPVMHQGIYDNPEGPFYLPYGQSPMRQVRRLTGKVRRLQLWVTGLTMSFVSLCVVLWVRW